MAQNLKEYLAAHPHKGFVSRPHYYETGDFVTFFLTDERAVAKRVDELLTVYLSMDDRTRLIGCKIKGVRRLLEEAGAFGVSVENRSVSLGLMFYLGSKTKEQLEDRELYRQAAELTKGIRFDSTSLGLIPAC